MTKIECVALMAARFQTCDNYTLHDKEAVEYAIKLYEEAEKQCKKENVKFDYSGS